MIRKPIIVLSLFAASGLLNTVSAPKAPGAQTAGHSGPKLPCWIDKVRTGHEKARRGCYSAIFNLIDVVQSIESEDCVTSCKISVQAMHQRFMTTTTVKDLSCSSSRSIFTFPKNKCMALPDFDYVKFKASETVSSQSPGQNPDCMRLPKQCKCQVDILVKSIFKLDSFRPVAPPSSTLVATEFRKASSPNTCGLDSFAKWLVEFAHPFQIADKSVAGEDEDCKEFKYRIPERRMHDGKEQIKMSGEEWRDETKEDWQKRQSEASQRSVAAKKSFESLFGPVKEQSGRKRKSDVCSEESSRIGGVEQPSCSKRSDPSHLSNSEANAQPSEGEGTCQTRTSAIAVFMADNTRDGLPSIEDLKSMQFFGELDDDFLGEL